MVFDMGVLISWCILLSFWLLGKLLPPLREYTRRRPSKEEFHFNKGFNKSSSVSRKQLAFLAIFGEVQVFTKFYVLMFLFIPGVIVLITRNAILGKVEGALFLSDFDEENVEIEQVILWLVVYCCCGCMFSKLLYFLQMIAVHEDKDFLFRKFPLQYSDKIFNQFAVIGSILLLFSSSSIRIKTADTENSDEDSVNDLLRATTCFPIVLMLKFGYIGYYKVFNWVWLGAFPGVQMLFLIAHWTGAFLVLFYISKTNFIAQYALLSCFIMFVVLPTLFWLLSFTRAELPPETVNRFNRVGRFDNDDERVFNTLYSKLAIVSKPSRIGLKHWIWSPARPQFLPLAGNIVMLPTELQNKSELLIMETKLEKHTVDSCPEPIIWVLIPTIICCALVSTITIKCSEVKGEWMTEIREVEKEFRSLVVSPPLGRSVSHLVGTYEVLIYFVDPPGFQCAFGYLSNLLKAININDGAVNPRCWFVFQCNCYLDYGALIDGLSRIFDDYKGILQEKVVGVYILYPTVPTELSAYNSAMLKLIEENSVVRLPHIGHINLSSLMELEDFESVVIVSIGSSYLANLSRQIGKNLKAGESIEVLDLIFEDSIQRMPVDGDEIYFPLKEGGTAVNYY